MMLTRLVLKDFGGHRNLEFAQTASTVGILGPNGAGKSTILSAINFLLTGETADAQETYVRAGCDNGSGDLTFQKNGMTGRIFRQIGKTPKRRLEWDGRVITKAAEVDETLGALFGADKKAVSSAVFIAQGDLQNILFGTQAEREALFIRLVNLAFCEQRAKMLDGKIKKLSLTVQDLGAVMDQARLEAQRAQLSLDEAHAQLVLLPAFETEIARLGVRISLTQHITEIGRARQEASSRAVTANDRLAQFVTAHGLSADLSLEQKTTAMSFALSFATKRVDDVRAAIESVKLLRVKEEEIARQVTVFKQADAAFTDAHSITQYQDKDRLEHLQREVNGKREYDRLVQQVDAALKQATKAREELTQLRDPNLGARITELMESTAHQRTLLDQTNRIIKYQEELTACLGKVDPTNQRCRECGLKIDANQELDTARLEELRTTAATIKAKLEEANTDLRTISGIQADFTSMHTGAVRNNQIYSAQHSDLANKLGGYECFAKVDLDAHSKEIVTISSRQNELRRLTNVRNDASLALEKLRLAVEPYMGAKQFDGNPEYTEAKLIEAIGQRDNLTKEHTRLLALQKEYAVLAVGCTESQNEVGRLAEREENLMAQLEAVPTTEALDQALATFNGQAELAKKELEARQAARNTQLGVVKQAEQGQRDTQAKLKELQGRIAQDQKKLDCIARLQEMKALLSRSGLPGQYVAHRFQQLVWLTQQHLGKLNASFLVTTDTETPLSFRFCRTDNGVDLPMGKMSGGQRVRLCLAFLMAVQSALVPDVGLLVLDEPSMHLDTEGKESLAELLRDAGQRLGGGENQIWLVDHAMELEPALGAVLKLGQPQ